MIAKYSSTQIQIGDNALAAQPSRSGRENISLHVRGQDPHSLLKLVYHQPNSQCRIMSSLTAAPISPSLHALIFGASGITGWAITNAALSYPTTNTFTRVVGLTSRPLSLADSGFSADPRLQLYSGLDLSKDADSITRYLKKIPDIEKITHVYFAGKTMNLLKINMLMLISIYSPSMGG